MRLWVRRYRTTCPASNAKVRSGAAGVSSFTTVSTRLASCNKMSTYGPRPILTACYVSSCQRVCVVLRAGCYNKMKLIQGTMNFFHKCQGARQDFVQTLIFLIWTDFCRSSVRSSLQVLLPGVSFEPLHQRSYYLYVALYNCGFGIQYR